MQPRRCQYCGNDAEYLAAFKNESAAALAYSDASALLHTAHAHLTQIYEDSGCSPKYFKQDRFASYTFGVSSAAFDKLQRARRVTYEVRRRLVRAMKTLAPAPTPVSLIFPVPFPPPGRTRAASLACPSLWTALEAAAAVRLAKGALPVVSALILPTDAAADSNVIGTRFRQLAKLLHPDRWACTWRAAQASAVPPSWAAILDVSLSTGGGPCKAGAPVGSAGSAPPVGCRWTEVDLQSATLAAFVAVQDAHTLLLRDQTQ